MLAEGDTVRTGSDGRASIDWPDGSVTRLDVSTTFRIDRLRSGSVLAPSTSVEATQDQGNTFSRVDDLTEAGDRFSIETPTATAAVQGTEYYVLVDGDSSTVVVTDGTVVVTTPSGDEVVVPAGSTVVVDANGAVDGPFPTPAGTLDDEWVRYNDRCDASGGVCPADAGPGAIDSIAIVPADATINLGESQAYSAEAFDAQAQSLGPVAATFAMDGEPCPGGVCTPVTAGDFAVTASFEGFEATGNLTVLTTGDVQVTLDWSAFVDLDLFVTDPNGETVSWQNPGSISGGRLDRDGYADCTPDDPPPENIVWDTSAPSGDYEVTVVVYSMCDTSSVEFDLVVRIGGTVVLSESGVLATDGAEYTTSFTKS